MKDDKLGVAIEYPGDIPKILAVARGILYDKLIEIAEKYNITIYEDPDLARVMSMIPVGSEIPDSLYRAVSEVLAYCYAVNEDFKNKIGSMGIL